MEMQPLVLSEENISMLKIVIPQLQTPFMVDAFTFQYKGEVVGCIAYETHELDHNDICVPHLFIGPKYRTPGVIRKVIGLLNSKFIPIIEGLGYHSISVSAPLDSPQMPKLFAACGITTTPAFVGELRL